MKSHKKSPKAAATSRTGAARRKTTVASGSTRLPKGVALTKLKLSRLGGDAKLATRLTSAGLTSLPQLALLDLRAIKGKLPGTLTPAEEKNLALLQKNARRLMTLSADRALIQMQALSAGGTWLLGKTKGVGTFPGTTSSGDKPPCHCGCCDSIFSLKAYLFDLLDLLAHYWLIDLKTVQTLLLRDLSAAVDCEALNASLPQARIACEVMEKYLQALGKSVTATTWPAQFVDGLLRLILPRQVAAAMIASDPRLAGRNKILFTIAKVEAAPKLTVDFAKAIGRWKTKLNTLTLDLTGIEWATLMLAEVSRGMIGHATDDKFAERREATVRQWLVDYRNALRKASGFSTDTLEASLFISLDSGSCRTSTRLQELVTSVQQIVESIRSGEIQRLRRPDLPTEVATLLQDAETLPLAEGAWTRFRDYETWLGYMYGWVYPENVLSPLSLFVGSEAREEVLGQLQAEPLTADSAGAINLFDVVAESGADSLPVAASLFPLAAALLLNRNQQYSAAHDWYRHLYDPVTSRVNIVFGLFTGDATSERSGTSWLDQPFGPIAIANRREGVWLRHTVLAMVRNLIDWADDEFARGLPDTYQRAEELYELARRTLRAPPLRSECEQVLLDVVDVIGDVLGYKVAIAYRMVRPLNDVADAALMSKAGKDIHKALNGRGSLEQKSRAVERIVARTVKADHRRHPDRSLAAEYSRQHTFAVDIENAIFFKPAPDGGPGGPGGRPFEPPPSGPAPGSVFPPDGRPFDDPIVVFEPLAPVLDPTPPPSARPFCVPPNPVLRSLQLQIDTQLYKLRHCLDFMGEPQIERVYGCDTYDAATGRINRPTAALDQYSYAVDQPRYRYSFLIEKARQYVDVAQRIGAILLQALQNKDNEAFLQLRARHAIELADATIELRRLGRQEAEDGVAIAGVQKKRADSQVEFWDSRAGDDVDNMWDSMSTAEQAGLVLSGISTGLSAALLLPAAHLAGASGFITAAGFAMTASGGGAPVGLPTIAVGLGMGALASGVALLSGGAGTAASASNTALTYASFERRLEDWKNQFELAGFDAQIAGLQVALADDRLEIAGQELEIALLQLSHAQEELRFLQTKTTNAALYDWMVRVLSRDYRVLMQIAACVARMAQRALEFERQETVRIVTGDYWNIAQGVLASTALTDKQRELGLLGAERLLTDLTKLDAFKLVTEKRRLQISKTFSLARMMPLEIVEFRDSGRITFNTLLDWFDEGFQGHYLRLIKSVRVSILALVPPIDGIHAMLHNTGESSVVVLEDGIFTVKRAARNFGESIALDSAFNESGLFVLNYEDPMLLPFEGLGVQTQWTLELPRGNNRFNFDSIADVFLTIEYTAEYSREYEQQLRDERTGEDVHEDAAIPLRVMFPDLWYHLKNHRPDAAGTFASFQFKFAASRHLFAPNLFLTPPAVEHLTMLVSGDFALPADSASIDPGVQQRIENGLTIKKGSVTLHAPLAKAFGPGVADSNSLMLSTRGAGAGLPTVSIEDLEIGASDEWILEFAPDFFSPVDPNPKPLIERIADVLLVITVMGKRA